MSVCFVIQPFDQGNFDNRYEDIYAPAIEKSGYQPYRVDRDPRVTIPIEDIQNGIRNADVCLVEMTLDNPNVWFELGFAIASNKDVVLICSTERTTAFPFDVRHRKIIKYSTGSRRDFEQLEKNIIESLNSIKEKNDKLDIISTHSPLIDTQGLAHHELMTLVTIAQNLSDQSDYVTAYVVKQDMERNGYAPIAVILGVNKLTETGYITVTEVEEYNSDPSRAYRLTTTGMTWLQNNIEKLVLKVEPSKGSLNRTNLPF